MTAPDHVDRIIPPGANVVPPRYEGSSACGLTVEAVSDLRPPRRSTGYGTDGIPVWTAGRVPQSYRSVSTSRWRLAGRAGAAPRMTIAGGCPGPSSDRA